MIMKCLNLMFLILIFPLICFSQTNDKRENFRLVQTKPSAYITFVRFVTREPRFIGENNEKVLLRLHNNTKWNLTISTLSRRTTEDECMVFYKIDQMFNLKTTDNKSGFPKINRVKHVSAEKQIGSGKSLLFTVPKEDLAKELYILVEFNYEWEAGGNGGSGNGYIFHEVPFYSTDLPTEKKN